MENWTRNWEADINERIWKIKQKTKKFEEIYKKDCVLIKWRLYNVYHTNMKFKKVKNNNKIFKKLLKLIKVK